jgi:predicted nucleotide-binding protein (sugar kinase/HSP70/actin superfamily)
MVVFEPIRHKPLDLIKSIHRLNVAHLLPWQIIGLLNRAWQMISYLDQLERRLHWTRPRELKPGTADAVYRTGIKNLCRERSLKGIIKEGRRALAAMNDVPVDPDIQPIKIGIVGEIYVVIEPAANLDIERILGELGVEVHRSIFLTGWTKENVVKEGHGVQAGVIARPYLGEMVGGHGQESIGHTIQYAEEGLDGVIQLAPFTCIPEIVAKSILPAVSRDYDIPVISFFLDEQTGEAGYRTRLEAFVDLLVRRRNQKQEQKQPA